MIRLGSGRGETSISYKDLEEGVYLIFGTYLYSYWTPYYMGIFCNYIKGGKYTRNLTKISSADVNVILDQENKTFNSDRVCSSLYVIQLGYW